VRKLSYLKSSLFGSIGLLSVAACTDQNAIAHTMQTQGTPAAAAQGPIVSGPAAGPGSSQAESPPGALPPPPGARPGIGDRAIESVEVRETAHELAHELERYYVFPETGRRYAAAIRANAARGAYDSYSSSAALAARLQADLLAVAPDNHLRVTVGAPDAPRPSVLAANPPPAQPPMRGRLVARPQEGSLGTSRWLAPGIAYLQINVFAGDDGQLAAVRQFMNDYADAKSVIFDLRTNQGGGFAEMDVMFPYLFDKPTTLAVLATRAEADPISFTRLLEGPTLKRIADADGYVRRAHSVEPLALGTLLRQAKIFVLTSKETRSSGEHFAMALKQTGRGTVIGETTGGAGHTTIMRMLGGGFAVAVPVGQTVNPTTGKGWEAVGIEPDVVVPSERALVEALIRSGVPKAQAESISSELRAVNSPSAS
jgi:hypothetical protein